MTSEELAEFRELAGLNEPQTQREKEKEWADAQITNIPDVPNQLPEPTLADFGLGNVKEHSYGGNSQIDNELEGLANRLNSQLGSTFGNSIKIERLN